MQHFTDTLIPEVGDIVEDVVDNLEQQFGPVNERVTENLKGNLKEKLHDRLAEIDDHYVSGLEAQIEDLKNKPSNLAEAEDEIQHLKNLVKYLVLFRSGGENVLKVSEENIDKFDEDSLDFSRDNSNKVRIEVIEYE